MGTVEIGKRIVSLARKLNAIERGVLVSPNIDLSTRDIAPDVDTKELLFVTSASAIHPNDKISTGVAFTTENVYYCNRKGQTSHFPLNQIESVSYEGKNAWGTYSPGDKVTVTLSDGEQHVLGECLLGCSCPGIVQILTEAAQIAVKIESRDELWRLSLCERPTWQQLNYMKVLYNYAHITGSGEGSDIYAALQSIGVRIDLSPETRGELKDYLFLMQEGSRIKTGILISRCKNAMSYGSYEIFRFSLMQDVLYLSFVNNSTPKWYEDAFINSLQKTLEITDEQIETMFAAIAIYKEMQKKDADLSELQKDLANLWRRVKALCIPREAVVCSGSAYSIDTYHGMLKNETLGKSITQQRELMLQAVIRNTQLATNRLVEDLNDTTLRLLDEISSGNQREQKIAELVEYIRNDQAKTMEMIHRSDEASIAQLYNKLPQYIPAYTVEQLLPERRSYVQNCYILEAQGSYRIKSDLSYGELTRLSRIEEIIDNE